MKGAYLGPEFSDAEIEAELVKSGAIFTKLSETTLPYDVVYILNKYYATFSQAIEANKGRLDKFIGDGIMAIF